MSEIIFKQILSEASLLDPPEGEAPQMQPCKLHESFLSAPVPWRARIYPHEVEAIYLQHRAVQGNFSTEG